MKRTSDAMNRALRTMSGRRDDRVNIALSARTLKVLRQTARDLGFITRRGTGVERGSISQVIELVGNEIAAGRLKLSPPTSE